MGKLGDQLTLHIVNYQSSLNQREPSSPLVPCRAASISESWRLLEADIQDPVGLLASLRDVSNPISAILLGAFSQETRDQLFASNGHGLQQTKTAELLSKELNRVIEDEPINLESCFIDLEMRNGTRSLLEKKPTGDALRRLKRLLLEDAFPGLIKRGKPEWDDPEKWLSSQDFVISVEKIRELVPNVAPWLIIQALCSNLQPTEDLLGGILPIIGDLAEPVCGTMTRKTWFEEVAKIIRAHGNTEDIFSSCLEKHWGPLKQSVTSEGVTKVKLNPLTYSAFCAARLRLWYDPREGAFHRYRPDSGTWMHHTDTEVQRVLLEWIRKGEVPEARPSLNLTVQVLKHLRLLALYEATDQPMRPVHLAESMLYPERDSTLRSVPFSPAYFSRNRIPVRYDSQKLCPKFEAFLKASLSQDDIELLQKWCGFVLLGKNPHHKILLVRGVGGSGKSTLMDIIEAIIGAENVATLNVERLDDRFELAAFRDKTLLLGKDVASNVFRSKAAHTLKALSGDQGIEAELKFENGRFKLRGPFNIAVTSNAELEIGLQGDAAAWERRLLIIDFPKPVPADRKETNFAQKLLSGTGKEGILNWMLEGVEKVIRMERANQRFTRSYQQKARLKRLLNQSSSNDFFIESCLEASPGTTVTSAELYKKYEDFCDRQVFNPIDENTFYRRIRKPIYRFYHSIPGEVDLKAEVNKSPGQGKVPRLKGYKGLRIKPESQWPPLSGEVMANAEYRKFSEKGVRDARGMISKLKDKSDPAFVWLEQRLRPEAQAGVRAYEDNTDRVALIKKIVADLNSIVNYPLIYDKERFGKVKLRELTRALLRQDPETDIEIRLLNKLLIEDVFADDLMHVSQAAEVTFPANGSSGAGGHG